MHLGDRCRFPFFLAPLDAASVSTFAPVHHRFSSASALHRHVIPHGCRIRILLRIGCLLYDHQSM